MEHNMAQLLRASRYAAHDPQLAQVWHNRGRFREAGEWGFKRTVNPKAVPHTLVTLAEMDHPCNYTNFDYAEKKVKAVRRFVANFGGTPPPRTRDPKPAGEVASFARHRFLESVDAMSGETWKKYLEETVRPSAPELRREWAVYKRSRGLEGKPFDELTEHCLRFLNLHLSHPGARLVARPLHYLSDVNASGANGNAASAAMARDYMSDKFGLDVGELNLSWTAQEAGGAAGSVFGPSDGGTRAARRPQGEEEVRTYAGPTYSHPQKLPSRKVRGRALNALHGDRSHLVVAVQGVTASLTGSGVYERARDTSGSLTREVSEFWVRSADTDRAGNPRVSLQQQSTLGIAARNTAIWNNPEAYRRRAGDPGKGGRTRGGSDPVAPLKQPM